MSKEERAFPVPRICGDRFGVRMKTLVLYQYYAPDDVIGAQQFTGLAEGLAARGYEVETWPCNRSRHLQQDSYTLKPTEINGVTVRRVWRPDFNQGRFLGRIVNALWMEAAWALRALFARKAPDTVIIGADPIFGLLLVPFFKLRWPRTKIAHWCFDLYPEYPIAEGMVKEKGFLVRVLRVLLRPAYAKCDLIANLGSCMKEKLSLYPISHSATLTPWAQEEPPQPLPFDTQERVELFGDSPLGILYSGNLSHPHRFDLTLELARKMGNSAVFAFSVRGNRVSDLKAALKPGDTNIRFTEFASQEKLAVRLSAPDVHLVSLKSSYMGVAVPSKFFGALAVGRPILFEGDEDSSIARWIREYELGWVLNSGNLEEMVSELEKFSSCPTRKAAVFKHCHQVYQERFTKKTVVDIWERELNGLLAS